jgi:hypothetical protein
MIDEDRFHRLKRDADNAPVYVAQVNIKVHYDGTMSMDGPFGDKDLFLQILDQARDCVKANAKDRGWVVMPPGHTDAKARPEGYG